MTSTLRLVELDRLSSRQRAVLGLLRISKLQIEFGGSFQTSIEECISGPRDSIRGVGVLLEDAPIGFVVLKRPPLSPEWASDDMVTIHGLKIDSRWQGYGHGKAAFRETMTLAKQLWPDAMKMALSVDADNGSALSLYKRFGMTDSGPVFRGRIGMEHRLEIALP